MDAYFMMALLEGFKAYPGAQMMMHGDGVIAVLVPDGRVFRVSVAEFPNLADYADANPGVLTS